MVTKEIDLNELLKRGISAHRVANLGTAESYYRRIIDLDPTHPHANHNLGLVAVSMGKREFALPHFKKALQSDETQEQFWLSYIKTLSDTKQTDLAAEQIYKAREAGHGGPKFDQLQSHLSENTGKLTGTPSVHQMQKLFSLYRAGMYREAIKEGLSLKENYLDSAAVLNLIGIASHAMKDNDAAITYYKEALEIKPKYSEALANLGVIYYEQGDVEKAGECYKEAIKATPDMPEAYNNLASSMLDSDEWSESEKNYRKVLILRPTFSEACSGLYYSLYHRGFLNDALRPLKWSLIVGEATTELFVNISDLYRQLGAYSNSMTNAFRSILMDPSNIAGYLQLGLTSVTNRKYPPAMLMYSRAGMLDPLHAGLHNNLSILNMEVNKLIKAETDIKKAILLSPNQNGYLNTLGDIFYALGNHIAVLQQFSRSMLINEKSLFADIKLIIFNFIFGNAEVARKLMEAFIDKQKLLNPKEKWDANGLLITAYQIYIGGLLKNEAVYKQPKWSGKMVHHLGESHSLSYANCLLEIDGATHKVQPHLIVGAKAWHFAMSKVSRYKTFLENIIKRIPDGEFVLLSFGEIDCRHNEGIISHCDKTGAEITKVIRKTVQGYTIYIDKIFQSKPKCRLYFLGIPAPVNRPDVKFEAMQNVAFVISVFNAELGKAVKALGHHFIDIYSFTKKERGFSNGLYHVDETHLGPTAIPKINELLSNVRNFRSIT